MDRPKFLPMWLIAKASFTNGLIAEFKDTSLHLGKIKVFGVAFVKGTNERNEFVEKKSNV